MTTWEDKVNLSRHLIDKAKNTYEEAKLLKADDKYTGAVNRLYYTVLYVANALLALKGQYPQKHSSAKTIFGMEFVKTGLIDRKYSEIFSDVKIIREKSDCG